jgi:hypothetical protein
MAHECCICGGECYCNGDIDDCVVSLTPSNCQTCGCGDEIDDWRYQDDLDDAANLDDNCPRCGKSYDEIDFEYQICSFCKFDYNQVNEVGEAEKCRECGCHDHMACMHPKQGACWWAEAASCNPDGSNFIGPLCSHCAMKLEHVERPWQQKQFPKWSDES